MEKQPHKQQIADLAFLLRQHGCENIVICPGSRNAPLIQLFESDPHFHCHSIVDERSAGYIALGMAGQTGKPVAVVTTSGTATLNLAPAVAEAFYQELPLVIVTADRPAEFPPQFSNQRIGQADIYAPNIKQSWQLPAGIDHITTPVKVVSRMDDLIGNACTVPMGPVHLNIPLEEPLYTPVTREPSVATTETKKRVQHPHRKTISAKDAALLKKHLTNNNRLLFIVGAGRYTEEEAALLAGLTDSFGVAVIAENITNLPPGKCISVPELVLGRADEKTREQLIPDLVVATGGAVVSKKTRLFAQGLKDVPLLLPDGIPVDLFREIMHAQEGQIKEPNSYAATWKALEEEAVILAETCFTNAAFSNLTACSMVLDRLPAGSTVHLGNSGTVRYAQLKKSRSDLRYQSNRGTSGIDGSLSTAVGAAMVSDRQHVIILGDLSFVYDSNAMWNRHFPANLQIIILNDKGGGIFRLLEGPDRMPFFEEFSVTAHPVALQQLAQAFELRYLQAEEPSAFKHALDQLFEDNQPPTVLEADTSKSENSRIFKQFFTQLQSLDHAKT